LFEKKTQKWRLIDAHLHFPHSSVIHLGLGTLPYTFNLIYKRCCRIIHIVNLEVWGFFKMWQEIGKLVRSPHLWKEKKTLLVDGVDGCIFPTQAKWSICILLEGVL
jgi:hypothetical protein